LLGAGKRTHTIVAIVAIDNAMESFPRQKIHELREESLRPRVFPPPFFCDAEFA
jgi:hypothetical protein